MTITSKGQVTIPQEVCERTGLLPNTEVELVVEGMDDRIVKSRAPRRPSRGARALRSLRAHGRGISMSTDEIMALTRSEG
ncbi:hypothetical protein BH23CHL8_BH23CHL8_10630 [soil metagenome]